jgi:carbon-monoxide dehydrogenase large subunit
VNEACIGRSVRRKEDPRLLAGQDRFIDDLKLPGQAYAYVLRSPHAHARIVELDIRAAAASDGVLAVFTAADLVAVGIVDLPPFYLPAPPEGDLMFASGFLIPARSRVRHIGVPVAFLGADTGCAALAAAERIVMAVDTLPAVTNTAEADRPGAPQVWADAPDNLVYVYAKGNRLAVDAAFADAAHIAVVELVNSRLMATSIEPRRALGSWDRESGRFTHHSTGQMPLRTRRYIAAALGEAPESLRIIVGDAAGAFGPRNMVYPEVVLVVWAAQRLGRPVKWAGGGEERFLGDTQARATLWA